MQIDDLTAGLSLNFLIHLNTEQLQFESKILEVYPRRHTLLAEGVFTDDKNYFFPGKRTARRLHCHISGGKATVVQKCDH